MTSSSVTGLACAWVKCAVTIWASNLNPCEFIYRAGAQKNTNIGSAKKDETSVLGPPITMCTQQTHLHHAMTMTIPINSISCPVFYFIKFPRQELYNLVFTWTSDLYGRQEELPMKPINQIFLLFFIKLSMIQCLLRSSSSQNTLDWMLSNLIQLTKSWVWSVVTGPWCTRVGSHMAIASELQ